MNFEVVFVHIGSPIPNYLKLNITRFVKLFPEICVTLIVSPEMQIQGLPNSIRIWNYTSNNYSEVLETNRDTSFRDGFWRFSLERLFALFAYQESQAIGKILHIESDVLILPNFPWTLISEIEKICWTPYNDMLDVAALLILPNLEESEKLIHSAINQLESDSSINDMKLLRKISISNELKVGYFPFDPTQVLIGEGSGDSVEGIFDGACIGVWLTGQDPRNNFGTTILHDNKLITKDKTVINPASYSYYLNLSGHLEIRVNNLITVSIYNLHIHSKNEALFGDNWINELNKYVQLSKEIGELSEFHGKVLWHQFREINNLKSLILFFLAEPHIYKLAFKFQRRNIRLYNFLRKIIT